MKCPLCNLEMRIVGSRYIAENDDTPDKPTQIFVEQDIACMNKECPNYEVKSQIKNKLG